jgi:hypothetical protein
MPELSYDEHSSSRAKVLASQGSDRVRSYLGNE